MAIIILNRCAGFVEIIPKDQECQGAIENYISNKLRYVLDDIVWISVDSIGFHIDGGVRNISLYDIGDVLKLRHRLDIWKSELRARFEEYDEAYIPERTESLDILEYAENEFLGGKREVYKDILEYMNEYGL